MELILLIASVLGVAWLFLSLDILVSQRESVPVALLAGFLTLLAFPIGVFLGRNIGK